MVGEITSVCLPTAPFIYVSVLSCHVQIHALPEGTQVGDRPMLIRVGGHCSSVDQANNTFGVDSCPYTNALGSSGWMSIQATFSSPRFAVMRQKPFPSPSNSVIVEGFADGVVWADTSKIRHICVNVERVAFPTRAKTHGSPEKGICICLPSMNCTCLLCSSYYSQIVAHQGA
jgi:hypothetical protein